VRVVTIGALNKSLIHFVVEGHGELRLDIGVALVAKLRLRRFEQVLYPAVVNIVAADAAHIAPGVVRIVEAPMTCQVTLKALGIRFSSVSIGRIEDLGFVAAFRMRFAGTVTTFATDRVPSVHRGRRCMGIASKIRGHLFVACGANVVAHEIPRLRVIRMRGDAHYHRPQRQHQTNL
jgi:hypothetical protein